MTIKLGIYKHYKGQKYEVLGIVKHSETMEDLVLYKALYSIIDFGEDFEKEPLFVRPKEMFFEEIAINNKEIKRFEFLRTK
jgi:hypothetical protein